MDNEKRGQQTASSCCSHKAGGKIPLVSGEAVSKWLQQTTDGKIHLVSGEAVNCKEYLPVATKLAVKYPSLVARPSASGFKTQQTVKFPSLVARPSVVKTT